VSNSIRKAIADHINLEDGPIDLGWVHGLPQGITVYKKMNVLHDVGEIALGGLDGEWLLDREYTEGVKDRRSTQKSITIEAQALKRDIDFRGTARMAHKYPKARGVMLRRGARVHVVGFWERGEWMDIKKWGRVASVSILAADELESWEKKADVVSNIMGGSAQVWGPDALLLSLTGPGVNLHFTQSGDVMTMELGALGNYEDLAQWISVSLPPEALKGRKPSQEYEEAENKKKYLHEVLLDGLRKAGMRVKMEGHRISVGGFADIVEVLTFMWDEEASQAIIDYFGRRPEGEIIETDHAASAEKGEDGETTEDEEDGELSEEELDALESA